MFLLFMLVMFFSIASGEDFSDALQRLRTGATARASYV